MKLLLIGVTCILSSASFVSNDTITISSKEKNITNLKEHRQMISGEDMLVNEVSFTDQKNMRHSCENKQCWNDIIKDILK